MYAFLSVILIIFGILQIILFFKLWGMTNDVRHISEKIWGRSNNNYSQLEKSIWQFLLENKKDKAIEFLNCNLSSELIEATRWGGETTDNVIQSIKNRYQNITKSSGFLSPSKSKKLIYYQTWKNCFETVNSKWIYAF